MTKNFFSEDLLATVRNVLKQEPHKWLNVKQVSARLPKDLNLSITEVESILDELVNQELASFQDFKYQYLESDEFEGIFLSTKSGLAFVKHPELDIEVMIEERHQSTALYGDTVRVRLLPYKEGRRQQGKVLAIVKRAKTQFLGYYFEDDGDSFVMPADRNLDIVFYIPDLERHSVEPGYKVIVELLQWQNRKKNPTGKIIKVLGKPGTHHTEMHAILAEFGFETEFPPEVEAEANTLPKEIPFEEIEKRKDLRNLLTFTIDPFDAKDFDDALSFQKLENGHFEVGVHIADVSYYVKPNTLLDQEAYKRGTSVYLVDRTVPMLPEALSNFLCSLRPYEDKLTFSILFEMDIHGNIYHQWIGKTIIRSQRRFTYEEAQEIIENPSGDYAEPLTILNKIAKSLATQRYQNGSITFETDEVKFKLDENYKPIEVYKKERKDAHKLIEEFMLLANRKVTEFVYHQREKPRNTFVYRVHDAPDPQKVEELSNFVRLFGFSQLHDEYKKRRFFNLSSKSLQNLMEAVENSPARDIIRSYAVKCMAKARYTTENVGHYGLAFPLYTHFTSPIRRYPDIMVHRLLEKYLDNQPSPNEEMLEKQCQHCSAMERKAAEAERASIRYKQAEYLAEHIGSLHEGIISGLTEWGIYVEIQAMRCEGMISLRDMYDDIYEYNEKLFAVVGQRTGRKFRFGDTIQVIVKRVNLLDRTIDFEWYNPSTAKKRN
ncbi:MAG: ribonuclease R [Bacteroidia bacterium]|nr:ribonuclease R [Bacteroidia bacterium]MDW8302820.1 ribonuclease R [Bacteroidia bacterium]